MNIKLIKYSLNNINHNNSVESKIWTILSTYISIQILVTCAGVLYQKKLTGEYIIFLVKKTSMKILRLRRIYFKI